MRRRILTSFVYMLVVAQVLVFGCEAKKLETPAYPLSEQTLSDVMEIYSISGRVITETNLPSNVTQYNIMPFDNEEFIMGIVNGTYKSERSLSIQFPTSQMEEIVAVSDANDMIKFATALFGGFVNDERILDFFSYDANKLNFSNENRPYWEGSVDGVDCKITLEVSHDKTTEELLLSTIHISTDIELFLSGEASWIKKQKP